MFIWQVCLVWDQTCSTICCQTACNVSYVSWAEQISVPKNIFGSIISDMCEVSTWETGISGTKWYFISFLFQYTSLLLLSETKWSAKHYLMYFLVLHLYANYIYRAWTAQQHLWWKIITLGLVSYDINPPMYNSEAEIFSCSSNLVK